jgi:hypothetical protein
MNNIDTVSLNEFRNANKENGIGFKNITLEHILKLKDMAEMFDGKLSSKDTNQMFEFIKFLMFEKNTNIYKLSESGFSYSSGSSKEEIILSKDKEQLEYIAGLLDEKYGDEENGFIVEEIIVKEIKNTLSEEEVSSIFSKYSN